MRRVRRFPVGLAAIVGVAALVGPPAGASLARNGRPWKSQNAFSESFFDSSTNETVSLGGTMSVRIKVTGDATTGFTYALHASVHHASGTGASSGGAYRLSGHDNVTVHLPPGGSPSHAATFQPSFTLHPPSPCRAHHPPSPCFNRTPFAVPVSASLDANGSVTGVEAGSSAT